MKPIILLSPSPATSEQSDTLHSPRSSMKKLDFSSSQTSLNSSLDLELDEAATDMDYSYFNEITPDSPQRPGSQYAISITDAKLMKYDIKRIPMSGMCSNDRTRDSEDEYVIFSDLHENYPTFCRHFVLYSSNPSSESYNKLNHSNSSYIMPSVMVSLSVSGVRKIRNINKKSYSQSSQRLEYHFVFSIDNQSYSVWKTDRDIIDLLGYVCRKSGCLDKSNKYGFFQNYYKFLKFWGVFSYKTNTVINITPKYAGHQLMLLHDMLKDLFFEIQDIETFLIFIFGSLPNKHNTFRPGNMVLRVGSTSNEINQNIRDNNLTHPWVISASKENHNIMNKSLVECFINFITGFFVCWFVTFLGHHSVSGIARSLLRSSNYAKGDSTDEHVNGCTVHKQIHGQVKC